MKDQRTEQGFTADAPHPVEGPSVKVMQALRDTLEEAHDTLHNCTAVLSARDCADVAKVMAEIRRVVAASYPASVEGRL